MSVYNCPRILTFKIKQIPFCYILTHFERSINAEQQMCNIEKDTAGGGGGGGGIQEIRI